MTFINTRLPQPSTQNPYRYQDVSPSPFNDLWPPTYFPGTPYRLRFTPSDREREHNRFARTVWFHWLINGWINNLPYRDLQVLDYHPISVAIREEIQLSSRRRRRHQQLRARRRHRILEHSLNEYNLRNRIVEVTESEYEPYSVSLTVSLGRRTPNASYLETFPSFYRH
jgi:hypothetical protein